VHAAEVAPGRTFAVRFDHGEDFYTALNDFCRTHDIRQGFIPMFIAGLRNVDLHLEYVEAIGDVTIPAGTPEASAQPRTSSAVRPIAVRSDDALPTTDRNHCCAAQLDALHELTKLTTIAIIAEALGYATKTIEQHASASACQENGGGWGSFVG
jgi:hypothetical protein